MNKYSKFSSQPPKAPIKATPVAPHGNAKPTAGAKSDKPAGAGPTPQK